MSEITKNNWNEKKEILFNKNLTENQFYYFLQILYKELGFKTYENDKEKLNLFFNINGKNPYMFNIFEKDSQINFVFVKNNNDFRIFFTDLNKKNNFNCVIIPKEIQEYFLLEGDFWFEIKYLGFQKFINSFKSNKVISKNYKTKITNYLKGHNILFEIVEKQKIDWKNQNLKYWKDLLFTIIKSIKNIDDNNSVKHDLISYTRDIFPKIKF